jgi:PPOX class probable F420-dependent enzyme
MGRMSDERWRAFVMEGTRTAMCCTTRADGRPHVAPVWFVLDDEGRFVFNTGATSVKGRTLLRDPRVALCVDDEVPPFAFVLAEGVAEISEDVDDLLAWATRIGGRYMGAERADEFGRRNGVPGELLVRVAPAKVIAIDDMTG